MSATATPGPTLVNTIWGSCSYLAVTPQSYRHWSRDSRVRSCTKLSRSQGLGRKSRIAPESSMRETRLAQGWILAEPETEDELDVGTAPTAEGFGFAVHYVDGDIAVTSERPETPFVPLQVMEAFLAAVKKWRKASA